jgi:hypothetical protein
MKNGLDWWAVTRDVAQTDEVTPYCVRTALAKKWGGAVWYNMYYSNYKPDYQRELWADCLAGGRVNYHPMYPVHDGSTLGSNHYALMQGELMRGECRVRLMNFITKSQLDCPIAIIFGHSCAMNWAGPHYDDVGLKLACALWNAGFPADLIPTSEIANGSLKIAADGSIQYGPQRYAAAVLYHPEFEGSSTADFLLRASQGGKPIYRVGDWTTDFGGKPFDAREALASVKILTDDPSAGSAEIVRYLKSIGVKQQPRAVPIPDAVWGPQPASPPTEGCCRLIDGTVIAAAGTRNVDGDPIVETLNVDGHDISVDAVGVIAVRLSKSGHLQALAAGGLRSFRLGKMRIELDERVDLALWRDSRGRMHGVIQGWSGPIPSPLAAIAADWQKLDLPAQLSPG